MRENYFLIHGSFGNPYVNWLRVACEEVGAELAPLGVGEGVEV